jgi:hypothetical protein
VDVIIGAEALCGYNLSSVGGGQGAPLTFPEVLGERGYLDLHGGPYGTGFRSTVCTSYDMSETQLIFYYVGYIKT